MVLLGVLLVLVAAGAAVWLVLGSQAVTAQVNLHTAGLKIGMTPLALLVAGAVILLVLWIGLALIRASVRRRRRPAREAREAQRQAELEENIRADERARAEETHRSAVAERDRVREDEFQSRLAERDRARDEEEQARMTEAEQRIRADERRRVESEYRDRSGDASAVAASPQSTGLTPSSEAPDATAAPESAGSWDESTAPRESTDPADGETPTESPTSTESSGTDHERFRTVADKLMGREPTGEA